MEVGDIKLHNKAVEQSRVRLSLQTNVWMMFRLGNGTEVSSGDEDVSRGARLARESSSRRRSLRRGLFPGARRPRLEAVRRHETGGTRTARPLRRDARRHHQELAADHAAAE